MNLVLQDHNSNVFVNAPYFESLTHQTGGADGLPWWLQPNVKCIKCQMHKSRYRPINFVIITLGWLRLSLNYLDDLVLFSTSYWCQPTFYTTVTSFLTLIYQWDHNPNFDVFETIINCDLSKVGHSPFIRITLILSCVLDEFVESVVVMKDVRILRWYPFHRMDGSLSRVHACPARM